MRFFLLGILLILGFNLIESSPSPEHDPETFSEISPTIKKQKSSTKNTIPEIEKNTSISTENKEENEIAENQILKRELIVCEPLQITSCIECNGMDCTELNIQVKRDVLYSVLGEDIPDVEMLKQMRPFQVEQLLESLIHEKYQGKEPFHIVWQDALRQEMKNHTCSTYEQNCYDYHLRMEEARVEFEPLHDEGFNF